MNPSPFLTVLCAAAAALLALGAVLTLGGNLGLLGGEYARTTGVVVDAESDGDTDGDPQYWAVVEYTVEGETYRITAAHASGLSPRTGSERKVLYSQQNPADASLLTIREVAMTPALLLGAAAGLFVVFKIRLSFYGLRPSRSLT